MARRANIRPGSKPGRVVTSSSFCRTNSLEDVNTGAKSGMMTGSQVQAKAKEENNEEVVQG
jgi:hypothetical protein